MAVGGSYVNGPYCGCSQPSRPCSSWGSAACVDSVHESVCTRRYLHGDSKTRPGLSLGARRLLPDCTPGGAAHRCLSTPRMNSSICPWALRKSVGAPVNSPPRSTQSVQCVALIWRLCTTERVGVIAARWIRLQPSMAALRPHVSLGGLNGPPPLSSTASSSMMETAVAAARAAMRPRRLIATIAEFGRPSLERALRFAWQGQRTVRTGVMLCVMISLGFFCFCFCFRSFVRVPNHRTN